MAASPNVLFIMTDQQRADGFGPGRHPCADYPAMEALARQSASFDRFYTAASPCAPSRHVFLTGRNEWMAGVHGNGKFLTGDQTTWMSVLRDHGYRCVSVGKTHMVHAGSFHLQVPVRQSFADQTESFNHFRLTATPEREEEFYDLQVARQSVSALQVLAGKAPFALFVGFHGPHQPYIMPRRYLDFVTPEQAPLPDTWQTDAATKSAAYQRKRQVLEQVNGGPLDAAAIRTGVAGYHSLLKVIDDGLALVLAELDRLGLADNTLVVFCSDHGEILGEQGIFNKAASFYEPEVRVPFLLRFPDGRHAGASVEHLASSLDFVPTLFAALGVEADLSLPGRSLLPALESGEAVRDSLLCSTGRGLMIRTQRHKLWYDAEHDDGELYDLAEDPAERDNRFGNADCAELQAALTLQMLRTRMGEDLANNRPTAQELRRRDEYEVTLEPEILVRRMMPPPVTEHIDAEVARLRRSTR